MIRGAVYSLLALFLFLLHSGCAPSTQALREVAWGRYEGKFGNNDGEFNSPGGIAFGSDKSMYVADTYNRRIQVFDQFGSYLRQWKVDARFETIATDGRDNFFVPLSSGHVIKYDRYGNEMLRWGLRPATPEQGYFRLGIAVDQNERRVYLAEFNGGSIQVFDCDGLFLGQWNKIWADGLVVDAQGDVYVASRPFGVPRGIVRKYDKAGVLLQEMPHLNTSCGGLQYPHGIAIDSDGNIIVSDALTNVVHKLGPDGQSLVCWGSLGSDAGEFCRPAHVAVASDNSIYVADNFNNHRIQRFTSDGVFIEEFGKLAPSCEAFVFPSSISISDDGTVYVADIHHVKAFDTRGALVACWGGLGSAAGELNEVASIAVHDGRIYVTDKFNSRVQVFDERGGVVSAWGLPGREEGEFDRPLGIAVDEGGLVFVVDDGNLRVQVFAPDGVFLRAFPVPDLSHGIAVDKKGGVYVTSRGTHTVRKYDDHGELVLEWGRQGIGDGEFDNPCGIAIASDGSVYIADFENSRVQKFDSGGAFIATWGRAGTKVGELFRPQGVACWGDYVFIADSNNHRIQRIHSSYWNPVGERPEGSH